MKNFTRTRWWNFKDDNVSTFKNKMKKETTWNLDEDNINIIWTMMTNKIRSLTKKTLSEAKGRGANLRED